MPISNLTSDATLRRGLSDPGGAREAETLADSCLSPGYVCMYGKYMSDEIGRAVFWEGMFRYCKGTT